MHNLNDDNKNDDDDDYDDYDYDDYDDDNDGADDDNIDGDDDDDDNDGDDDDANDGDGDDDDDADDDDADRLNVIFLLQVPDLLQASAVMRLQSSRLSAVLRRFGVLFFSLRNVILCRRPRSLFPRILAVSTCLSTSSFLYKCPRIAICLLRACCKSHLCIPARLNTYSFVTLSIHEVCDVLRKNHNSATAILFEISLSTLQLSHPV